MPSLHGVEVVQIDDGLRPIQTVESSIIGLVGTAPDATAAFPLNTPIPMTGPRMAAGLGDDGALRDAYLAIYAPSAGARSVAIGDIVIHAAPGMSPGDVARAVRREPERLTAAREAELHDGAAYDAA